MQIEVNEIEPCRLTINYVADSKEISAKKSEILKSFKKAPVKGFRKGKVPLDVIELKYKNEIDFSLKRALAEDAYHNTIFEKNLNVIGSPQFNLMLLGNGKFNCEFEISVKPEVNLTDLSSLEVVKPEMTETVSSLSEKMLEDLRRRFGQSTQFVESDVVEKGDNIIIKYEAFSDGTKVESLSADSELLTVGSSNVPEFDNSFIGLKVGEEVEFNILAPQASLPSLAGKTVHFKANVINGAKITPSPLDDSLAAKLNKKDFEELRSFVNTVAKQRLDEELKAKTNNALSNLLVSKHDFLVPQWMKLAEAKYLAQSSKLNWESLSDEDKQKYIDMSEKNIKLALVLEKVRESEPEAQLTDQEVYNTISQNIGSAAPGTNVEDTLKNMAKTGYLQVLAVKIKDEYTLDFIAKKIKIIE